MIIFNDFVINIISLCSGKLEIALLISFILATSEIKLIYRIIGSIVAIIFIILFNFLRILITIYFISINDLKTSEFLHDILFRIFLFFSIAFFYYIWLKISIKKQKNND